MRPSSGSAASFPPPRWWEQSTLLWGEFLGLKEHGAVGDVCCHFLDAEGNPCLPELSERIVGLTLEQLRAIPKTIGIATGAEKAPGVAAVLRGSYVDVLITDQELAEGLLELAL